MERYSLSLNILSLHILILCIFTCYPAATSQGVCDLVFCGQGTCNLTNSLFPGFECNCYPGWKKIQIGPLTFPACLIPNCTVNLDCGNGSPPPPPPSVSSPPPPLNLTSPCNLIWCAEGKCMPNGTGHTCQCNPGSANLVNNTELPCFKQCFLGADCTDLELLPTPTPSPPPNSGSNGSPPPSPTDSVGNGAREGLMHSWRSVGAHSMIWLGATFLTLI